MLQLSHISVHHLIINFISNCPIIVFNTNFLFYFYIYTFSNLSPPLPFYLHYPLHKYNSSSFSSSSFILSLLIHTFLLYICNYLFHYMHGFLSQKKSSLSLSLSQFFDEFFIHSSIYAK